METPADDLFEVAFEHSAIGKVLLDMSGRIIRVNRAICEALGYAPEELVGLADNDVAHPDEIDRFAEQFGALVRGETQSYQVERRYRRRDGAWIWFSLIVSMARDSDGSPRAIVAELQDLTERHATEAELRRRRAEAEAAAVAKSEFLANMSHELRTPLTGVIGFAGLLEAMDGLPAKARTYVGRLVSGGDALLSIVNNILDFTKLETGHFELDPQPFDPRALVDEATALVQPEASQKGLGLRTEVHGGVPRSVSGDASRIRQVLLNLLGNAIKFTPQGEVVVAVSYDGEGGGEGEGGGRLRFSVTDTGIGIPSALSHRLFQRFSQIDGSISREYGGAGLGLAISRGLAEMMGGQIGVESKEGVGSTFWFTVAAAATTASNSSVVGAAQSEAKDLSARRILIVDDVAMNRELLAELLRPLRCETVEASDGADGVAASMRTAFDLILMDLQMPGMDGYAATRAIRANSELNSATPILGVSANVLPIHIEACRDAGMNDYISKPIDPTSLIAKIVQFAPSERVSAA